MYSTRVSQLIRAPRATVYRVLLDPDAVARWRVPDGMTGTVHEFDARVGGRFRVSLTYDDPGRGGKTRGRTDTYHGHFAELVPDEKVVEVTEFETTDPALAAPMTMTTLLADAPGGTAVTFLHEDVPDVIPPEDNEAGTRMALANLARLAESATGEATASA